MKWTALLRTLPRDLRETVAGDLEEEYLARRARHGRARAALWAWVTAGRLGIAFRVERITHVRGVPPLREELRSRTRMWDAVRQDVGFSLRLLVRQPGFTLVALVALALGIGANTAIFSVVDAVLWRPLPYIDSDRMLSIAEQRPREGRWFGPVSPADFFDFRRDSRSFSAMAAFNDGTVNLTGAGEPERLRGLLVTDGFLRVLGISPVHGRDFRPEEETVGRHRVVLLTDGLWRRRFGADPAIVGRAITFDGNPYEVVGVLPPSFWWPTHPDALAPLALSDYDRRLRAAHFLEIIGRLRPDVSAASAHEELAVIGARLATAYPVENARHFPNTRPVRDALVGDVRTPLLVLLGAVGFVLLIACANVATLLLARAVGRQKELAVRRALGATRRRLAGQMLTESLIVALIGGAGGILMAAWGLAALRGIVPSQFANLPGIDHLALDVRILSATFVLTLVTGIVFGSVPALVVSDQRMGGVLTEESRGGSGTPRARRVRSALVVAELALSFILLTGATLLIVSFERLTDVAPGFRSEQLITTRISLPASGYREHSRVVAFYEELFARLSAIPGVQRVGATTSPPFGGPDSRLNLTIEKRTVEATGPVRAHPRLASKDYFAAMGIPLIRGRGFTDADNDASPKVVIINQTAVRRYWPNEDPIGQRISLGAEDNWMEIVGIVGDVRHAGLDAEANPEAYIPQRQIFTSLGAALGRSMAVVVRTTLDLGATASAIRSAVKEIDASQPVGVVRTMGDMIAESVAPRRLNLVLVSAFACVAVLLTAAGLYGVMAYLVAQRTREIGVRMALGASRQQVLAMVMQQAGRIAAVGIAVGVAGALLLTQSMTSMLFGVSPADPLIYVAVSLLLGLIAAAAVVVPSSRATRVDPLTALRDE